MVFTCHEYYSRFEFFQPHANVKIIFNLWAIHKKATAQIWPLGHRLLIPGQLEVLKKDEEHT